jgi:signal transduction histidine kinase/CheY-like chemotaxis protein
MVDIVFGPDNMAYMAGPGCLFTKTIYDNDSVVSEIKTVPPEPGFNRISRIAFGPGQNLWTGTDQGLFVMDIKGNTMTLYDKIKYPEQKYVTDFLFDRSGKMWIIFTTVIIRHDINTGRTETFRLPLPGNPVLTRLYETNDGRIMVGTYEQGLYYSGEEDIQFKCLLDEINVSAIFEDNSGRLWIGTQSSGVFVYDPLMNFFSQLQIRPGDKSISSFQCDIMLNHRDEGLWIGSRSYGLLYYDFKTGNTTVIDPVNNMIDLIYEDKEERIWYNHGNYLLCYDPAQKTTNSYRHPVPYQFPVLNTGNTLTAIVPFNGKMIIGSDYGQVFLFDDENREFRLIYENPGSPVRVMLAESDSLMLCAYRLGVVVLDSAFTPVDTIYHNDKEKGLYDHLIMVIHRDRFDSLWIGGFGGFSRYNSEENLFEPVLSFGESPNFITSLLEDDAGNFWIGTSKGICKYERATQKFILFDVMHGMPPCRFFVSSVAKTSDGLMYFGGNNGIVFFRPDHIRTNHTPPPVVLTGFYTSGPEEKDGRGHVDLSDMINSMADVHLKYFENSFTINFAALNFTSPLRNQYRYILKGLETDWNYAGNRTQATYTKLDGGNYTFYVSGSNNDGVWNPEPRSLHIRIDKPPWKRWWAITLYLISLSAAIITVFFYNLKRIRLQHAIEIKESEARSLAEINETKSRFFTSISHEFRTPLTLILDPAKQLLSDQGIRIKQKKYLKLITSNAERLMTQVNQIMDLSKLKNGQLNMHFEEVDLHDYIIPIFSAFRSRAEALKLGYELVFADEVSNLRIDREKMRYVILNILSNAFKFCPSGKIVMTVGSEDEKAIIKISDTGIGIPADQVDRVFDEYYQVKSNYQQNLAGTGLGLALAKEYVTLHRGTIEVRSEENIGTEFIISLPKGLGHFRLPEINARKSVNESLKVQEENPGLSERTVSGSRESADKASKILLIEDDIDMTTYLVEALRDRYNIITAVNGADGLEKTLSDHPDLVISDIMMPVSDGYTYCQKLKQDERISHIPVILLTARADHKDKIKGLYIGADDYLEKPFSIDELELRIRNHIDRFRKLQSLFMKDFRFMSNDEINNSCQDPFLQKTFSFIEKYYTDDQFGVERLSEMMMMSRTHFYRKIKKMTSETPNEMVRNYRLRKARSLLSERRGNVTEVCFESGFRNLSYFSRCFYIYYGKHPSDIYKE